LEGTRNRGAAAGARAAWRQGVAWVRRNPGPALGVALGGAVLVLVVRWLMPTSVTTVTVERREVVETLVTTGRVRSISRVAVGAPLVGTVERVAVDEGDRVSAGQLLVSLSDAEAQAAVAEARARLLSAEAALSRVGSVELPGAAASLEAAALEARQLARDVERLGELHAAGALSQQELEAAQRAAESAQARLESARARAGGLAGGGADRRAAEAGVAQARQSVDAAQARLELTRVRSPAAGTVLIRSVEAGDAVQPGRVLMEDRPRRTNGTGRLPR
jgi:HlyD family secretion protein